jgi:hypothetical protein
MTPLRWKVVGVIAAALVLSLGAAVLYVRQGVKVRIHNSGSEALREIVVHVAGNSYPLGDLRPGSTVSTRVIAQGESHVEVDFKTDRGGSKRLVADCYFEGDGYRGTISVELDSERILKVKDSVSIGY